MRPRPLSSAGVHGDSQTTCTSTNHALQRTAAGCRGCNRLDHSLNDQNYGVKYEADYLLGFCELMNALFSKGGSGIGSLICFLVLLAVVSRASERGWPPLWCALVVGLSLCYLWRFFLQPFMAGLREERHDKTNKT